MNDNVEFTTTDPEARRAWTLLESVPDPEIPVLSVIDLGIVRWVRTSAGGVSVGVAPTYTGCPATEVIAGSISNQLRNGGFDPVSVERVLSPPWTTDWITAAGRQKLAAFGIAPPGQSSVSRRALIDGSEPAIACPRCTGTRTTRVSEFGSTPCKASYKCDACLEPFEYFKCL